MTVCGLRTICMQFLHDSSFAHIKNDTTVRTVLTGFKLLGFWVLRTSFLLVNIRANLVKKNKKRRKLVLATGS
jgi:hypothetical protein